MCQLHAIVRTEPLKLIEVLNLFIGHINSNYCVQVKWDTCTACDLFPGFVAACHICFINVRSAVANQGTRSHLQVLHFLISKYRLIQLYIQLLQSLQSALFTNHKSPGNIEDITQLCMSVPYPFFNRVLVRREENNNLENSPSLTLSRNKMVVHPLVVQQLIVVDQTPL